MDRRHFLNNMAGGVMGAAAATTLACGASPLRRTGVRRHGAADVPHSAVALVRGTDRRTLIRDAVDTFDDDLRDAVGDRRILVKINCNRPAELITRSHPDSVRGILDIVTRWHDRTITVGESISGSTADETYRFYGYDKLVSEYDIRLVDLNDESMIPSWIYDKDLAPTRIRVLEPFIDPDVFVISVTPMKTHDSVVVTLTIKNVVMGSPAKIPRLNINDKSRMHAGNSPKLINLNIFNLSQDVRPDFSVIDGLVGAEGDGPNRCDPVDHKIAVAGLDAVAVDLIGADLMGVPEGEAAYLDWAALAGLGQGDRDRIDIVGPNPGSLVMPYRMHKNIEWQRQWRREMDWDLMHGKKGT